jgi:hypothetical protein
VHMPRCLKFAVEFERDHCGLVTRENYR